MSHAAATFFDSIECKVRKAVAESWCSTQQIQYGKVWYHGRLAAASGVVQLHMNPHKTPPSGLFLFERARISEAM
jgi:hypothetical protein